MKNSYLSKALRTLTSVLSIQDGRVGSCKRCGECCKLPRKCLFLDYDVTGGTKCKIYGVRSLNCRKYPRSEKEHITKENCGYCFNDEKT